MTFVIIGVTVGAYLVQVVADSTGHSGFLDALVLYPQRFHWWGLVTYAFLHGGLLHIGFNMLFLWVFGPNVEDRMGRIGFAAFYLVGGAASGAAHVLFSPHPVIGASGAVAAVTGAFLVLFPRTHIRLLLFFIIIGVFSIPSWWFIAFAVVRDFVPFAGAIDDGVSHAAHLGGYVFGAGVAVVLLWTKVLAREPYDLFSMAKHKVRQRQFRELTHRAQTEPSRVSAERKMSRAERESAEALAGARAEVATRVGEGDLDGGAGAYRALLREHGATEGAATLSRAHQITVANHLFSSGDHQTAALAYERFLSAYGNDGEAPGVRLMLGLIYARYLNDPVRGKTLITEAKGKLRSDDEERLAEELLEELG